MHLFIFVVPEVYIWPLGEKKQKHLALDRKKNEKQVWGAPQEQPDLKDGGDKQPVPLQVMLVVENMTVSQVHHQCFFCVLNTNTENIRAATYFHNRLIS